MNTPTLGYRSTYGRMAASVLLAVIVAACGETQISGICDPLTDSTCTPTDTTTMGSPLAVTQVTPVDGATSVATGSNVVVTFNRSVAAASVTSSSVSVGSTSGDLSVSGSTVTFTPAADLSEGTSYTVTVDGVTDEAGTGLLAAFSSSFSTVSSPVSADAGPDFDASMGASVTLDSGASSGTGATFTWTQLSGPDVGALTGDSPTFTAPAEVSNLSFELSVSDGSTTEMDTVRVWVLEDANQAFWVSPSGDASNPGTRAEPFSSIQDAIDVADNAGLGADVYIAAGTYDESLTLRSRVSLYGGFEDTDWMRDVDTRRPVVNGGAVAVRSLTANDLTIDGLEIVAANATGVGASSIAVVLNASNGVVLTRNVITAGDATAGAAGSTPSRTRRGANGSDGGGARGCVSRTAGGSRGVNYRDGGTGGLGGWTNPTGGGKGEGSNGGNAGGAGSSGSKNGKDGGNGKASGSAGANGSAGSAFGSVDADGNYIVDSDATGGEGGGNGYGGGGGGGAYGYIATCGGSGGGGGGGGEGGDGATPGQGGGASFAILVMGQGTVSVIDNELTTGAGGQGGVGPAGGAGGLGGTGGDGGNRGCDVTWPNPCTGSGGDGGNGTSGGRGGHGGSGGGGPSIGIVEGAASTVTESGNVFTLGAPGAGGNGPGNDGPTGESANHKKLN